MIIAGNFLITYIRIWQMMLNRLGIAHYELNTYIISVLTIFFLQVNHKFPTIGESSAGFPSTIFDFKPVLRQFFDFYGNQYDISNQVISAHIGKWQQRENPPQKSDLTHFQALLVSFVGFNSI